VRDDELFRLRRQIKSLYRRLQRQVPAVEGVSFSGLQILFALDRSTTPLRPGQIAEELEMTNSNVAAALRALEAGDLVVLHADPSDGRKSFVHLMKTASKVVAEVRLRYYGWLRRAIEATLSPEEYALLLRAGELMERVSNYVDPPGHQPPATAIKIGAPAKRRSTKRELVEI
jgi:DNA-binding MarR family transcriptional regulator